MKFPYLRNAGYDTPIIPLTLRRGDLCIVTEALVDSGAASSVFDAQFARLLGIHAPDQDGTKVVFEGASGHPLVGYRHEVTIEISGHQFTKIPIAFTRDMPDNAVNILGQEGFFDLFPITFTYSEREIELRLENRTHT
jgi:hypothetical protein